MTGVTDVIMESASGSRRDPEFPNAPAEWTPEAAAKTAQQGGLQLGGDHWEAVKALQDYYARHDNTGINTRELHDALSERFHSRGGMKFLY